MKAQINILITTNTMSKKHTINLNGSPRGAGLTFYEKNGRTVIRTSRSLQPRRQTRAQFKVRMRFLHTHTLWSALKDCCTPFFTGSEGAYRLFCRLAAKLPALYLTSYEYGCGAALLLPGTPVSCGTLPAVACRLGSWQGRPALLTDLEAEALADGAQLWLVEARQTTDNGLPRLQVTRERIEPEALQPADDGLALVDDRFADADGGWALVLRKRGRCSTQTLVSAATAYRRYQTAAALQRAARSFGGLTG